VFTRHVFEVTDQMFDMCTTVLCYMLKLLQQQNYFKSCWAGGNIRWFKSGDASD
jgi:hypothetical protein